MNIGSISTFMTIHFEITFYDIRLTFIIQNMTTIFSTFFYTILNYIFFSLLIIFFDTDCKTEGKWRFIN